jgi:Domain of unknown function (DUF6249)
MGFFEAIIPLVAIVSVFGSITAIIVIPIWLKSRERVRMQDTVREAIERGQTLPADVIEAIARGAKPLPSRTRDIRKAVIFLAIAGVIVVWGVLDQAHGGWVDPSAWYGFAALPGFIGLAFLAFGLLNNKRD